MLLDDWNENSVLLHPGSLRQELLKQTSDTPTFRLDPSKHILETALIWKEQLAMNQNISSTDIAVQVGVTSGRVRQILRFTNLHLNVQTHIVELLTSQGRKAVPERLLRQLQKAPQTKQMQQLKQLLPDQSTICNSRNSL